MNIMDLIIIIIISGDEKKVLPHVETSKLMAEFIYYIKQRVDADINNEDIDSKFKDYSRPKMLMLSGHEVFLIDALGLNFSYYRFPKFAAQMAFEVTRKNEGPKSSYSDYIVHYYFNDEEIYNLTLDDFIEKIEPHIWSDKQINDFCGFDEETDTFIMPSKKDNAKKAYKILMIIFIILSVILLASTIFLAKKLSSQRKTHSLNISNTSSKM